MNANGASTLSPKGDPRWIATERSNVLLNPLEGEQLILEAKIAGGCFVISAEETEHGEPVIDCHKHQVFVQQVSWPDGLHGAVAIEKSTAVQVGEHRQTSDPLALRVVVVVELLR